MLVVCGWVPAGEALGSGVTGAVGRGEVWTGLIVAVGSGPAGMLGLGSGLASSLGDCAAAAPAVVTITPRVSVHCNSFVIQRASPERPAADVAELLAKLSRELASP